MTYMKTATDPMSTEELAQYFNGVRFACGKHRTAHVFLTPDCATFTVRLVYQNYDTDEFRVCAERADLESLTAAMSFGRSEALRLGWV